MQTEEKETNESQVSSRASDSISSKGIFGQGLNHAIIRIISWFLFGAVAAVAGFLVSKFQSIEESITRHHGAGWEEQLDTIVRVTELQEGLKQLEENSKRIGRLSNLLRQSQIEFFTWASQLDREKAQEATKEIGGLAEVNNRLPTGDNKYFCTINWAHPQGERVDLGNHIQITNKTTSFDQTISCHIHSAMREQTIPGVLLQVNQDAASQLDNIYAQGRIKVAIDLQYADDTTRWTPLSHPNLDEKNWSNDTKFSQY